MAIAMNPDFNWWRFGGEAAQDLGYGLANSSSVGNAFGLATQYGARQQPARDEAAQAAQDRKQQLLEKNQTSDWIKANFPQYGNLPTSQGFQLAMQDLQAQRNVASNADATDPASIREWNTFSAMTPEQQGQYLRMKRANPYLDVGTGFVQPDPINPGQTSGPAITKDNFTPAYDSALGGASAKVDSENQAAFDSLNSKLPGIKAVVDQLGTLADKATYTTAGRLWDDVVRETGNLPTEGAVARSQYTSMIDNQILPLLRDTFGAQFTQKEGETLRNTLGDPNLSPKEKKAVLESFIQQKVRDLEALQSRLPSQGGAVNYKDKYGLD